MSLLSLQLVATPRRRFVLAPVLFCLLAGCEAPGKPDPADRPQRPGQVTDFATLYGQNCAGCHGDNGQLGPAPPLNDPLFLALVADDVLRRIINEGRQGTLMPAFGAHQGGTLNSKQVDALVAGMRLQWGTGAPPAVHDLPPYQLTPADRGPPAPDDLSAGRQIFAMACAGCHGENGLGGPHAGAINDRAFLTLISDQALRRIIITGRPDLGMPDYRSPEHRPPQFQPLTSQEIANLTALLASWRKPPGSATD
jgi:mono/diheme cytochrome c family protein